ncbi:hypothetical protein L211DRAFT_871136 [Terfezia boudieri ATCC MYA-4762]|uniref:Queuosine 5'-phosphate N-glycosylase/hydrolase n=1 Tax=Terfezia boudieri ATCC MYA-4762 TaxID=1051890 RepID=A0A3N4L9J5_9PEZI|nr:hypothetical protein L211DRAFT_871136 [Terfezia boudieri ATCC MYA-4762]
MYSSDEDEPDLDLLALLRSHLTLKSNKSPKVDTRALRDAEYIADNAIDVALQREHIIEAADSIWFSMQEKGYSTETWSEHEIHPKEKNEETLNFIFTLDLLNFSFWSELNHEKRFSIQYRGKKWTGYWSIVATLQRALDEGIPITSPYFWVDEQICPDELLRHVFRSDSEEDIPLLDDRIACLREAGEVLCKRYDGRFAHMVTEANESASALVMLLAENFPCFDDSHQWVPSGGTARTVHFYKRAQILVADIWACFNKTSYGTFNDISTITMFADYRVPVILHYLSCLRYSPPLTSHIHNLIPIPTGHSFEIQIRGCSIWCVEMIKRTIERRHPESRGRINSILIDFYLYDTAKEMEKKAIEREEEEKWRNVEENIPMGDLRRVFGGALEVGKKMRKGGNWEDRDGVEKGAMIPHHRTRSIWY